MITFKGDWLLAIGLQGQPEGKLISSLKKNQNKLDQLHFLRKMQNTKLGEKSNKQLFYK